MSISLWDLSALCGLPVQGAEVDEYLPTNKAFAAMDLANRVWNIWSRLSINDKPYWNHWSRLFGCTSDPSRNHHLSPSDELWISEEDLTSIKPHEELCLFLMLWLSIHVFPSSYGANAVRSSLILPASQLAQGQRLALAPRVLCEIYRGLNEMATAINGPMSIDTYFPAHYLGLYFPWTFGLERIADAQDNSLLLRRFSGCLMANLSCSDTTHRLLHTVFLSKGIFRLSPRASEADIYKDVNEELSHEETDFAMSLVPCLPPSRESLDVLGLTPSAVCSSIWLRPGLSSRTQ
jgi:hypothetical protein